MLYIKTNPKTMPNYCHNTLTITSKSKQSLEDFYQTNYKDQSQPLSFEKLVPVISGEENNMNQLDCSEMWGTKWDAIDVEKTSLIDDTLTYYFDSAWSPPTTWLGKVAALYPDINFEIEYSASGDDFWGKQIYSEGFMEKEECESLGKRNWRLCDKEILKAVIEKNMDLITKDNYLLRIDIIIDDYAFEADYHENIEQYVEYIVEQKLGLIPSSSDISNVLL